MEQKTIDLLRSRAIEMAKEPEQKKEISTIQLITFTLAAEIYGIESGFISEIYQLKDFTPLPGVASYVLGIISVRGKIVPVVDLKKFFNFPELGITELNKVIILHDEQMEFGIIVDDVYGMQEIEIDEINFVPSTITGKGHEFLLGITKENLIVLDAGKLLSDKRIVINDEVPD